MPIYQRHREDFVVRKSEVVDINVPFVGSEGKALSAVLNLPIDPESH